jgi:FAD/FMN-containing dehydrogenase
MVSSASKHPEVLTQSTPGYEQLRTRYFNGRVSSARPAEIHLPTSTAEVVQAINKAKAKGLKVGVRSGGHLFPACSLLEGGMLIDTRNLNRNTEYDINTKQLSFGPGNTSQELQQYLSSIERFLPFGHSPTVGVGGFLLAGGQGWFFRGWGLTSSTWITQIEIVTSSGHTILASKTQNPDIFWAIPGSGQGFFGVITRFWAKTIPARKVFWSNIVFDVTDSFKPLLKWVLQTSDKVPRYGVDMTVSVMYADRDSKEDDPSNNKKIILLSCIVYADSLDEAKVLLSPWDSVPQQFQKQLLVRNNVEPTTWENLWNQDEMFPSGERWKCDSILTKPEASYDEVSSYLPLTK